MSYAPPTERPKAGLPVDAVVKTIPWHKFQFNPNFLEAQPAILVACGSFSPISTLHVQMLTMIREHLMVKNHFAHVIGGILSPVSDGYGKASLIGEQHRLKMCQLATDDVSWVGPTSVEIDQGKWVETRLIFDQLYDAVQLVFGAEKQAFATQIQLPSIPLLIFCMGSDVFLGFRHESWWSHQDVEIYCTRYRLAVIVRGDDAEDVKELLKVHPVLQKHQSSIFIIPPNFTNSISSTLIRNQSDTDSSLYGLVHPKVDAYMKENKLYGYGDMGTKDKEGGEGLYTPLFIPQ